MALDPDTPLIDMLEQPKIGFLKDGEVIVETTRKERPTVCTLNIIDSFIIGGKEYALDYRYSDRISSFNHRTLPVYGAQIYHFRNFELDEVSENGLRLHFGVIAVNLCSHYDKDLYPPRSGFNMAKLAPKPVANEYSCKIGFSPDRVWVAPNYNRCMQKKKDFLIFFEHMRGFCLVAPVAEAVLKTIFLRGDKSPAGPLAEPNAHAKFPLYLP